MPASANSFTDLYSERKTITGQLDALDRDTGRHGTDPALLDELPELASRLDGLPERIQAELFAAFDIQILWNAPMKQATFFATITDTTPGIVTGLLARAGNDPATRQHRHGPGPGPRQHRHVFGSTTYRDAAGNSAQLDAGTPSSLPRGSRRGPGCGAA